VAKNHPPWFDTDGCNLKQRPYVFVGNTYDADSGNTNCRLVISVCDMYIVRTKTIKAGSGESCFDANKISTPSICCDKWKPYFSATSVGAGLECSEYVGDGMEAIQKGIRKGICKWVTVGDKCDPTLDADCDGVGNDTDDDPFTDTRPLNQNAGWGYIDKQPFVVYKEPSTDSPVLGQLNGLAGMRIIYSDVVESNGKLWYQYTRGNSVGWVPDSEVRCGPWPHAGIEPVPPPVPYGAPPRGVTWEGQIAGSRG
jgi:putative component of membrane protein insertase Oxa1/YidC/SpoIIIJ protein YidD